MFIIHQPLKWNKEIMLLIMMMVMMMVMMVMVMIADHNVIVHHRFKAILVSHESQSLITQRYDENSPG